MRQYQLKNTKYRISEELKSVARKLYLILIGTTLYNSTEELLALLKISYSDTFESKEALVKKFGQLTDKKKANNLNTVLRSILL